MSNNRSGNDFSSVFMKVLRDIFGWFAGVLGICLVAGGIGTAAGFFIGLPYTLALGCGLLAIVLVLAVWLFMMSGGDLF